MWIKQRNTEIEYLYEKYAEPISTITWALDNTDKYEFPQEYLYTGLKWLIKNHPHDSICGCSIDQVHDEMETRFDWAEQIADELYKDAFIHLHKLLKLDNSVNDEKNAFALILYNPLPWKRKDEVKFTGVLFGNQGKGKAEGEAEGKGEGEEKREAEGLNDGVKIVDTAGNPVDYQYCETEEEARYSRVSNISYQISFLAEVPACGFKTYYVIPGQKPELKEYEAPEFNITERMIENKYYKVSLEGETMLTVEDKRTGTIYENICYIEDVGDWGDEYDFSGPNEDQNDTTFTSEDMLFHNSEIILDGMTQKTLELNFTLELPVSLTEDRIKRSEKLCENQITVSLSLYRDIKRIDFTIELNNRSKDHRIRVIFPSQIKSEQVYADGHFYVVPRDIKLPKAEHWAQDPLPTNHQKDFLCVEDDSSCFAVLNKGLPEYEAIQNDDSTISLAVTLLRCVEWLSRGDLATRGSNAGPDLNAPGAQCLERNTFELGLVIEDTPHWMEAAIHRRAKEFNIPLRPIFPQMASTPLRVDDHIILSSLGILEIFRDSQERKTERFLPSELSFLTIDNPKIMLSALKRAETENVLVVRCYNLSSTPEAANLNFTDFITLQNAEIVNLLEETPNNTIKAEIESLEDRRLQVSLQPHVIATFKVQFTTILRESTIL
jgi:alpha-mannosidase